LNTVTGFKVGACGPKFYNTSCVTGFCSPQGACGLGDAFSSGRVWGVKYDSSQLNKACFATVKASALKKSKVAFKKNNKKMVKHVAKKLAKAKKAKKPKQVKKLIKKLKVVKKDAKKNLTKHFAKIHKVVKKVKKTFKKIQNSKPCNVKLNTFPGMIHGRCGAPFKKSVCSTGYCSQWNWCGLTPIYHTPHRSHGTKFDANSAPRNCFKRVSHKALRHTVKAMKKGVKHVIKHAKAVMKKSKHGKTWAKWIKGAAHVVKKVWNHHVK
jgi:hypothetical protein